MNSNSNNNSKNLQRKISKAKDSYSCHSSRMREHESHLPSKFSKTSGSSSSKSSVSSSIHLKASDTYKSTSSNTRGTSPSPSLVRRKNRDDYQHTPHPPRYPPSNTTSVVGKSPLPLRVYSRQSEALSRSPQYRSSTKPPLPPQYTYPRESIDSQFSGSTRRDSVISSDGSAGSSLLRNPCNLTTSQLRDDSYARSYTAGDDLAPHDSNISASRERRRQKKKEDKIVAAPVEMSKKKKPSNFELPTVNHGPRRASSVGECLNYVGVHSSSLPTQNKPPALASSQRTHFSHESNFGRELGTDRSGDGRLQAYLGASINSPTSERSVTPRASPSSPNNHQLSPNDRLYHLLSTTRKNTGVKTPTSQSSLNQSMQQLSLDSVEEAYVKSGVAGLMNLGNTCYMNSTIQCLSHTLEMTDIFLNSKEHTGAFCSEYRKALQLMWLQPSSSDKYSRTQIKASPLYSTVGSYMPAISLRSLRDLVNRKHPQFRGYMESDAQEFLRILISDLHEEMKPARTKKDAPNVSTSGLSVQEQSKARWKLIQSVEGSPIASIFMGQFKSSLQCTICKNCSLTFESFWDMGLPIAAPSSHSRTVNLLKCFSLFTREEILDGDNRPFCSKCCKERRSVKKMTVHIFPPVLTLYLKRFSVFSGLDKLHTAISIPRTVNLMSLASSETVKEANVSWFNYELYATINHSGTMLGGHYTATVQHFTSEQWYSISDSRVSKCTLTPEFSSSDAYILFYRRAIA